MRIVDYETFIRMPSGTIFAPWTPCTTLEEPEIKVDHGWEYTDDSGNIRTIVEMLVGCLTERALLCLGQSNVMGSILENANLNFSITMATALMHQNIKCSLFTKKMTSIIL